MTLDSASAVAQVIGAIVVIVGLIFGVDQVRQLRAQRRDSAAVELVRSIQDAEFTRAVRLIFSLAPGTTAADLRARGAEFEDAAMTLAMRFEMLGVLVYRRTISFEVMDDLAGGVTVALWERLRDWVRDSREALDHAMYMEWFQWLAEQFIKLDRLHALPAHQSHRDWRP